MRPDESPCKFCPKQGCGKQAQCKDYLVFYASNREKDKKKLEEGKINAYTKEAIAKMKSGRHCTADRYRPKGRW